MAAVVGAGVEAEPTAATSLAPGRLAARRLALVSPRLIVPRWLNKAIALCNLPGDGIGGMNAKLCCLALLHDLVASWAQ